MNQEQTGFYNFFMSKVKDDRAEEAKAILLNNFKMQDAGTFDKKAMADSMKVLLECVKEEHRADLMAASAHYSNNKKEQGKI